MRLKIISHSGSFLTFQPPFAADPEKSADPRVGCAAWTLMAVEVGLEQSKGAKSN